MTTELLILRDGRILVHQLTPVFAELLGRLNPSDFPFKMRVPKARKNGSIKKLSTGGMGTEK